MLVPIALVIHPIVLAEGRRFGTTSRIDFSTFLIGKAGGICGYCVVKDHRAKPGFMGSESQVHVLNLEYGS